MPDAMFPVRCVEAGHLVLVTDYKEKLTGTVEELDKGTVAVFDPGFDKFDEIEILEVHNG